MLQQTCGFIFFNFFEIFKFSFVNFILFRKEFFSLNSNLLINLNKKSYICNLLKTKELNNIFSFL